MVGVYQKFGAPSRQKVRMTPDFYFPLIPRGFGLYFGISDGQAIAALRQSIGGVSHP